MSALRIVLAILAILALLVWVWTFAFGIPRFMQVFRDMEVSNFPGVTLAAMGISGFVTRYLVAVVVLGAILAGALVWLARLPRISNALSISASTAVGVSAVVTVLLGSWSVFGAMASLIEEMQRQAM